jgi:pantoate--beta-alanine ligase
MREADGLAMNSRNQYLSAAERTQAGEIYKVLTAAAAALRAGEAPKAVKRAGMARLAAAGFRPDYVAVRDARDLGPPGLGGMVVLAAAWLGRARLIDNLRV